VAFVGECSDETPIKISPDMIRKGIVLIGSWHYNLKDVPKLMQVVQKNGTKLDRLISHRFSLSQVQDAWTLQATGNCAKVLLKPWEGVL
jgi:threonine dehydrogenase-like Zn-dependent dehydrogenase